MNPFFSACSLTNPDNASLEFISPWGNVLQVQLPLEVKHPQDLHDAPLLAVLGLKPEDLELILQPALHHQALFRKQAWEPFDRRHSERDLSLDSHSILIEHIYNSKHMHRMTSEKAVQMMMLRRLSRPHLPVPKNTSQMDILDFHTITAHLEAMRYLPLLLRSLCMEAFTVGLRHALTFLTEETASEQKSVMKPCACRLYMEWPRTLEMRTNFLCPIDYLGKGCRWRPYFPPCIGNIQPETRRTSPNTSQLRSKGHNFNNSEDRCGCNTLYNSSPSPATEHVLSPVGRTETYWGPWSPLGVVSQDGARRSLTKGCSILHCFATWKYMYSGGVDPPERTNCSDYVLPNASNASFSQSDPLYIVSLLFSLVEELLCP